LAGKDSSHAGGRMPAEPDCWRVILLTRDVSLDEAPGLTDRERDVARHAVHGRNNREIAGELAMTEPAVLDLLRHAYRKLRAHRRSELILRLALGHRVEPAED